MTDIKPQISEAQRISSRTNTGQNFPQFLVIHTVKGFGIVNKAEIDVFLEISCFFHDPADLDNSFKKNIAFLPYVNVLGTKFTLCLMELIIYLRRQRKAQSYSDPGPQFEEAHQQVSKQLDVLERLITGNRLLLSFFCKGTLMDEF